MNFLRKLFFQIWYYREPPWDTNQTPPEVYSFIKNRPPGSVLDLGCGTGTNVITLAKHGWQATGVDFIPRPIATARCKARRAGVQVDFHVANVTRLNGIDGPFDLILDIGCYQSLDQAGMTAYREKVSTILTPGGFYMVYLFFRSLGAPTGSGAAEADLIPFLDFMHLVSREDGTERGIRKSSWLTYQKPEFI